MTSSRSDRPYGSFPGGRGPAREPEAAPSPAPRPGRRELIRRRLALPVLLAVMLAATWGLVAAVQTGALRAIDDAAVQPTPAPTPPLAQAVYDHVAPSVVEVIASGPAGETAVGAGVVVDDAADILTSLHIVDGATRVRVRFADGTESAATVASALPEKDIAVLRPDAPPAQVIPATLGDPGRLAVGVPAFAIGHPFGLTGSLSAGVISGLGRSVDIPGRSPLTGLIQFDAAVNPGNSGGPLVDSSGEVVGIVTGLVNPSGLKVFSGVGFAVTIDQAAGALGQPVD